MTDWQRKRDEYGRDSMTKPGEWCDRCGRVHVLTVTKSQGYYWRHNGPHMTRHETAAEAMA